MQPDQPADAETPLMKRSAQFADNPGPVRFRVVIPVFNPPAKFLDFIGDLERKNPGVTASLIVVDDGSTNGVVEEAQNRFPEVDVVRGSGSLWWAGGMRVGMERALESEIEAVVWLNHDCLPDPGTLDGIASLAAQKGVGAVSAWCYCREDPRYAVNPGFRDWKEISGGELEGGEPVEVDGVNGNCTAISVSAIRRVGLPRPDWHRHYGDGPYTWRLRRAGFRNYVAPRWRAALEREFERCISERDHSEFWRAGIGEKLRYYFFSNRSKFHWKHRFYDLIVFQGPVKGPLLYPFVLGKLAWNVTRGHLNRSGDIDDKIEGVIDRYKDRFPPGCLRRDLEKLANQSAK